VREILETVRASARINRKDLAEKLISSDAKDDAAEKMKLALAAELRWLIREGHIVEFNDGALDLPRVKVVAPTETAENKVDSSAFLSVAAGDGAIDSAQVLPQDVAGSIRSVQDEDLGSADTISADIGSPPAEGNEPGEAGADASEPGL
jgi:hypothetical protein